MYCTESSQRGMGKINGRVTWFSFGRTHAVSTGTRAMAHFIDVVLQLEPPMIPMVRCTLLPQNFHLAFPPDLASPHNHEERTKVV